MHFISWMPWITCMQEKGVPAKEIYFILSSEINVYKKQIKVISITSEMI